MALKEKRDNDYEGIQEPEGKKKFKPKLLVDDDIKKIINDLDPNNTGSYPPTTSNTGQPKAYPDKTDFITEIEGLNLEPDIKEAVIRIILQHAENDNAWKRTVDIEGEQFYRTDGCHKIEAINGDLKFEMTDGGIVIDSGDKDVTIKCRKFNVLNELEDNTTFSDDLLYHYGNTEEYTYGTSYSEFHGTSKETFYGHKEETHSGTVAENFYGNKFCHTVASVEDFHEGHKIETFVGPQESFSLAQALEVYVGFKEELALAGTLAISIGMATEWHMLGKVSIAHGWKLEKDDTKIENSTALKILSFGIGCFA